LNQAPLWDEVRDELKTLREELAGLGQGFGDDLPDATAGWERRDVITLVQQSDGTYALPRRIED